ncbi:hypothetical protein OC846_001912 [Tilletia horrida]|uniref:ATPase inhibitor, mitochondrial n=1 Tax=Tilletia horrida TaxID=155126 RepID=A0AAN6GSW6_9BASI|nr:hypothetical protein OC846_001912 [Tilletia horrida]KAK0568326.1 hypothetical protein OC861_002037 [Tilletia horrida]
MLALATRSTARTIVSRSATRFVPAALAGARLASPARFYADGEKTISPGTTGSFNKREQSEEAAYVRKQEQEQLKKLRESIAKQKAHLEEVEKALEDVASSQKK